MSVPAKDRITVVERVYYQPFGEQPSSTESCFSRELATQEQPFNRRLTLTEEWQPLQYTWPEHVGMLLLSNREGKNRQTIPTEEEKADTARRIVEMGYTDSDCYWLVPPGESMRVYPSHPNGLRFRCQSGTAQVTVTLFPA